VEEENRDEEARLQVVQTSVEHFDLIAGVPWECLKVENANLEERAIRPWTESQEKGCDVLFKSHQKGRKRRRAMLGRYPSRNPSTLCDEEPWKDTEQMNTAVSW
jgi:hypothetical protein